MAENSAKSDGRGAENVSPKLRKEMQEEVFQFLVQLEAILRELKEARKSELADKRHA